MLNLYLYLLFSHLNCRGLCQNSKHSSLLKYVTCIRFIFLCLFFSLPFCLLILYLNFDGCLLQYNARLYLESFAVELVVLAIWKKALEVCNSWLASINEGVSPGSTSANESRISCGDVCLSQTMEQKINFSDPPSVYMWAKQGFIIAVDRAEKLSCNIQNMDGRTRTAFCFWVYSIPFLLFKKMSSCVLKSAGKYICRSSRDARCNGDHIPRSTLSWEKWCCKYISCIVRLSTRA